MEEILAVIVGAGALALSPLLAPAVRPVAKSAIKSGLAVAGAAKDVAVATRDAAVATGEQCRDAVTKASEALKPGAKASAAEAAPETGNAPAEAAGSNAAEAATPVHVAAPRALGLAPMMKAIIKSSQSVADLTLGAVTGVGKQWSAVIADARTHDAVSTEEAADETAPVAGADAVPTGLDLAPITDGLRKSAQTVAVFAANLVAEAGRQWTEIIADAQASVKGGAAAEEMQAAPVEISPTVVIDQAAVAAPAPAPVSEPVAPPEPAATAAAPVPAADDLTVIKGIGPKTAALLQEAGITTLDQLAALDVEQLRALLTSAGSRYRVIDPAGWPAEAQRLAAARGN